MEASALSHASRRGLLARKSPLLKLQGDEKLIAMARSGNSGAFEMIVDRYQGRLLGFCRQMLGSTEDAEDVLQEVFVNAYRAMLADEREINLRPWLYRIARNRCLNHLRKPSADAQESMDMVPEVEAASTAEKVHNREEFRQIISDVNKLPETQRSALLLREMDALSYEEIADAMETTVPSVKSLLVRARISLAEASQARLLTCNEVRVELSEAAEGLRKVSAPVRRHVRECEECADFRSQVRSNEKLLAALFPVPALLAFKGFIAGKLGLSGGSAASSAAAGGAAASGGAAAAGGAASGIGAALGGGGAAGGLGGLGGAIGGAIGTKAVAGVVTAAVITAGAAVELPKEQHSSTPVAPIHKEAPAPEPVAHVAETPPSGGVEAAITPASEVESSKPAIASNIVAVAPSEAEEVQAATESAPTEEASATAAEEEAAPTEGLGESEVADEPVAGASEVEGDKNHTGGIEVESGVATGPTTTPGAHGGKGTVTVTVTPEAPPATTTPPPTTTAPPPATEAPVEATSPPAEAPPTTETPVEASPTTEVAP
ncbi:MAG: sigma-70 family RNA polymerase sigma factor [Actinobacteria bacterium]|nr:sigma-70 family RNA polymerase sigma factor [Actinomycetota bacterium]